MMINNPTFLVIDDNMDNISVIKAYLKRIYNNHAVILHALSGDEGIETARSVDPDVILLDILMPNMDGFETCGTLRSDPITEETPVVFVTALRENNDTKLKALRCRADGFLTKPIDQTSLTVMMNAMLKLREAVIHRRNEKERLQLLIRDRTRKLEKELEERKKTERLLLESNERFQKLFDNAPLGYQSLDIDGNLLEVNQTWCAMLGYEKQEVVGTWFGDYLTPAYREQFKERFKLFKSLGKIHSEFEMVCRNGDVRFIEFEGVIGHNDKLEFEQTYCNVNDITDILQTRKNIKESEKRYRNLVNNLEAGVVVHAPDTSIVMNNERACELLQLSYDEITGKKANDPIWKFIDEEMDPIPLDGYPVNLIVSSKKPLKEMILGVVTASSEGITWLKVNGVPNLDNDGHIIDITISFIDITETKKREGRLLHAANYDFLTGLHNRRYFEEQLALIDVSDNYPITIVMADINGLKLVNDAFGHKSGDKLLKMAADVIKKYCNKNHLLARIGGDEFVIAMPNTSEKEAEEIVNTIHTESHKVNIESINLSISFGYKSKTSSTEDINEIYRSAEDLMYREKLIEIPSMRSGAIETILNTLFEKDMYSEMHSRMVSDISQRLASACGMNRQDVSEIKTAGLLHDIGKIITPSAIINKVGALTNEEYEVIKKHPEIGFRILNSSQDMRGISDVVLNHHERWDGHGYPRGIKGEDIPLKSRIIAIADAFDAMTSHRTYQKIKSHEEALEEIVLHAGTQFDPDLVEVFRDHFSDIIHSKRV